MSVRITDNSAKIKLDTSQSVSLFLRYLLDDVDRFANPVTPKDQGRLRESPLKTVSGERGTIVWNKEYAAAQEAGTTRGYPMRHYTTPGTGPGYAEHGAQEAVKNAGSTMLKARLI